MPLLKPFRGIQINRTHPLAKGIIGYWLCNDGTGPKVWDYSGHANKGTLEGGATWAAGNRGWAINCDGIDGRLDCGNSPPLDQIGNGSFWISFRMKSKDAVPLNTGALFSKYPDAGTGIFLDSYGTANRLRLYINHSGNTVNAPFSVVTQPFDTVFNHIIFVINQTTDRAIVYMNTVKDATEIDISSIPADFTTSVSVNWGSRDGGSNPYEGLIDDMIVGLGIPTQETINWLYWNPSAMFEAPSQGRFLFIVPVITTIYAALGKKLFNTAAVTALVGDRIYHGRIPETESSMPVINYYKVESFPMYAGIAERPRYRISCRDNTPAGAQALATEVIGTLNNMQETINSFDIQNIYYDSKRMIIESNSIYHVPVDLYPLYLN